MKNVEDNITGFQFDLYLPDGITIAKDAYGDEMISLATDRTTLTRHSVSCNTQDDGAMRVACTSLKNNVFTGTDGVVLNITVNVDGDIEDGDYPLIMQKIELTTPTLVQYKTERVKSTLTVSSYTLGDVNNDHEVTVTDVAGVVNFILNVNTEGLNRRAADINNDDDITVADAAGTVNILLGSTSSAKFLAASGSSSLSVAPFCITAGQQVEVPVVLCSNANEITGLQFDLTLPAGLRLVDVTSDRRHQAAFADQPESTQRVVAISTSNATFNGNGENVMTLILEADDSLCDGKISFSAIEMVRPDMRVSKQEGFSAQFTTGTTGINAISTDAGEQVFDLQGRHASKNARGVIIVNGIKKTAK